jgi:hypothetical protein
MANARKRRPGKAVAATRPVETLIRVIRGQKVMLDSDLAELYEVPTKRLNEAVRRNLKRFPETFMFRLSQEESAALRSQFATLETGRGRYSKYPPLAFTEHGVVIGVPIWHLKRNARRLTRLILRNWVPASFPAYGAGGQGIDCVPSGPY